MLLNLYCCCCCCSIVNTCHWYCTKCRFCHACGCVVMCILVSLSSIRYDVCKYCTRLALNKNSVNFIHFAPHTHTHSHFTCQKFDSMHHRSSTFRFSFDGMQQCKCSFQWHCAVFSLSLSLLLFLVLLLLLPLLSCFFGIWSFSLSLSFRFNSFFYFHLFDLCYLIQVLHATTDT